MSYFKKILLLVLLALISPVQIQAEMVSSSYVIHENVNYSFDGPVISAVSGSVNDNEFTAIWNTDVEADSFVEYSLESSFVGSQEAGVRDLVTSHNIVVENLSYNTTYYYRVKSKRVNGDVSISSSDSFLIGADPADEDEDEGNKSGGGMIIIDKTDKIAPEISNINTFEIGFNGLRVTWQTNADIGSIRKNIAFIY